MTAPWFRSQPIQRLPNRRQGCSRSLIPWRPIRAMSCFSPPAGIAPLSTNGSTGFRLGSQRNTQPASPSATPTRKSTSLYPPLGWKANPLPILEMYADRVPGAFVEEKEFSLVWHYRNANPEQGSVAARELTDHLLVFTASIDLQVLRGNKAIEIRKAGVNKGSAVQQWLAKNDFDFIWALGDDLTDEDMFAVLPPWAYSFRVGTNRTHARFRLPSPVEVLQILAELATGQVASKTESLDRASANPASNIPQT